MIYQLKKICSLPKFLHYMFPENSSSGYACWEPNSGYADLVKTTQWLADEAINLGVYFFESTKVVKIEKLNNKWNLLLDDKRIINAKGIVLATGAWAKELCAQLGYSVDVRSKAIQAEFVRTLSLSESLPAIIFSEPDIYMRPLSSYTWLVGSATDRWDVELTQYTMKDALHTQKTLNAIKNTLTTDFFNLLPLGARVGFDGYTSGNTGYLGFSENHKNLIFAFGWNGMGFKLFPSIAITITDLIINMEK